MNTRYSELPQQDEGIMKQEDDLHNSPESYTCTQQNSISEVRIQCNVLTQVTTAWELQGAMLSLTFFTTQLELATDSLHSHM